MSLTSAMFFSSKVPECHRIILCFIHFLITSAHSWVFSARKWKFQIFILVKVENKYENLLSSFFLLNTQPMVHYHENPIYWKTFLNPPLLWGDTNISQYLRHNLRKSSKYGDILNFPWRVILTKISIKPSLPHNFCPARSNN